MAIAVTGSTQNQGVNPGSSKTFSHTTASGDTTLVVICPCAGDSVTSVTFNTVALTQAISDTNNTAFCSIWYLQGPDITTADVVVTMNSSSAIAASAINLSGCGGLGGTSSTDYTSSTNQSTTVTVQAAAGIVFECHSLGSSSGNTIGGGQTEVCNVDLGGGAPGLGSYESHTGSDVTMSYTSSGTATGTIVAAEFVEASFIPRVRFV